MPGALVTCAIAFAGATAWESISTIHTSPTSSAMSNPGNSTRDRRLKSVICGATKSADTGNAGFPKATAIVAPLVKGENEVEIELHENPHPDTAYLDIELAHPPGGGWFYLKYELWPGPPGDIPFGGSAESGQRPIASASYADDFTIPAADASSDLYLRYSFEGAPASGEVRRATPHRPSMSDRWRRAAAAC